jgi:hypothetical protein
MRHSRLALSVVALAFIVHADSRTTAAPSQAVQSLDAVNVRLAGLGTKYRVAKMEYITAPGSGQFGSTVFAKDVGNRQIPYQFVPDLLAYADTFPGRLSYTIDTTEGAANGGLTVAQTSGAIHRAMATWAGQTCGPIPMLSVNASGLDLGVVQNLLGYGGVLGWAADVTHAGWLPGAFFDELATGGSGFIIAVTFTFIWEDGAGNPLDSDGDHKIDTAFTEIYYNDAFMWTNNVVDYTSPFIDTETIALHESGHALGQNHFGQIFFDGKGTKEPGFQLNHLHFSPRAVMNAIYWDTQRSPLTTDTAGHCSIWGTWGQ